MPWWDVALLGGGVLLGCALLVAWLLRRDAQVRELMEAFAQLAWRYRFAVAWRVARDGRVGRRARLLLLSLAAYLLLPFDLVPDFIPVLGQLDDLLAIGAALWLLLRLVPRAVLQEHLEFFARRKDSR